MKTIEEILYAEFTPDLHLVVDCCKSKVTKDRWYRNAVLVSDEIARDGKVTFICPTCNSTYSILEKHVREARTHSSNYAANNN